MKAPYLAFTFAAAAPLLAGCAASSADYPSLAIRDFERERGSLDAPEAAPSAEPTPLPQDKAARIAALTEQLRGAHARFMDEAPGARSAARAATGTAPGDDRWAQAQVALASLDSQRSQAAVALGDLDLMFTDATLAFEQRDAIAAAREEALVKLREQDAILAELREIVAR